MRNGGLLNFKFHRNDITRELSTPHRNSPPSLSFLQSISIRQVDCKMKNGVVQKRNSQKWHPVILNSQYRWQTRRWASAFQRFLQVSSFYCSQLYTWWLLQLIVISQIRSFVWQLRSTNIHNAWHRHQQKVIIIVTCNEPLMLFKQ